MIIAIALLFRAVAHPPQPASYTHLIPAPQTEQVTTGQCGNQNVVVRIAMKAGSPKRGWQQTIENTVGTIRVPDANERRLNAALDTFGFVADVSIHCLDGRAAQLSFRGSVTRSTLSKVMNVNVDGARIYDIR